MKNEIKIVIGSWGSYTACNERALGSSYFTLSRYEDWEEIVKELKRQGFELSGIDEELFIQDIEGLPLDCENWDYMSPKELFESFRESGVLESEYLYSVLCAYLEVRSLREFIEKVETHGKTGTITFISIKAMTGKITEKNCLKAVREKSTTISSNSLTLRHTAKRSE